MTHILIPREPNDILLRPFVNCPQDELPLAWAAMVRAAEVQHASAGRQCPAQIEEPAGAAPAAVARSITESYTLAEIKAKIASHDYNAELLLQHAMRLLEPVAAPALEAPAAPIQHQGMTIAGNGAAELGKLMRDQRDSRLGVYPDGNPNSGQP